MSLAIGHFAVGAAIATVLIGIVAPRTRFKGTLIVLSGLWGMVPDAYRASPAYLGWLKRIHDTPLANVFWFHRELDLTDVHDSVGFSARLVAVWLCAAIAVELGGFVVSSLAKRRNRHADHGFDTSD